MQIILFNECDPVHTRRPKYTTIVDNDQVPILTYMVQNGDILGSPLLYSMYNATFGTCAISIITLFFDYITRLLAIHYNIEALRTYEFMGRIVLLFCYCVCSETRNMGTIAPLRQLLLLPFISVVLSVLCYGNFIAPNCERI